MHRLTGLVFALLVICSLIGVVATLLDVRVDAGSRAAAPAVQHRAQRCGRSRGAARPRPGAVRPRSVGEVSGRAQFVVALRRRSSELGRQ
jgi:hypothetical protein